jgi:hypothetical protein
MLAGGAQRGAGTLGGRRRVRGAARRRRRARLSRLRARLWAGLFPAAPVGGYPELSVAARCALRSTISPQPPSARPGLF